MRHPAEPDHFVETSVPEFSSQRPSSLLALVYEVGWMANAFEEEFRGYVRDVENRCNMARESQFEAAGHWDSVNRWLGLAAVISGVVGGGSAAGAAAWGTSWSVPIAAVSSTLAGVLAAANSFLKPSDRQNDHKRAGDGWSILRDKLRRLGQLDTCCSQTPQAMLASLDELLEEKKQVTLASPVIPSRIYNRVTRRRNKEIIKAAARAAHP
jgi:hypothetical protein